MSTPLRDEPRAKRPADVDRRRKHEATHRCALGAGGLRPFAALGLVMTRRSSSRVARYRTSLVIARRVSSRVARHRPSPVISACMQPAPSDIDPAPRRAASEATGSRDRGCCSARRFAERHPRSTGNEPTQPGGPLVPSRLCNAAPQRSLRTALRAESGRTSDSPSIPPGEVDLAQIPIFRTIRTSSRLSALSNSRGEAARTSGRRRPSMSKSPAWGSHPVSSSTIRTVFSLSRTPHAAIRRRTMAVVAGLAACLAGGAVAGGSNCCVANGGVGCDDAECQDLVWAADEFCCSTQWDSLCANAAN